MKRSKIMLTIATLSAVFLMGFSPCLNRASAEEQNLIPTEIEMVEQQEKLIETTVEETAEEEDMRDVMLPIICGVAGLAGVALIFLVFRKKLKNIGVIFNTIVSWFTKKKEELSEEEIDLSKIRKSIQEAVKSNEEVKTLMLEAYTQSKEEYKALCQMVQETVSVALAMVDEMKAKYETNATCVGNQFQQLKTILVKMATGTAELVRRGTADEIVQVSEKPLGIEGGEVNVG